ILRIAAADLPRSQLSLLERYWLFLRLRMLKKISPWSLAIELTISTFTFANINPFDPPLKTRGQFFVFTAIPFGINGKIISCAALNPSPLWTRKTNEPKFLCPFGWISSNKRYLQF